jgi:hypothetical protein
MKKIKKSNNKKVHGNDSSLLLLAAFDSPLNKTQSFESSLNNLN